MRRRGRFGTPMVLGLLLVFLGTGCGGGGGGVPPPAGPPPSDALFTGTYGLVALSASGGAPLDFVCAWGALSADGAGQLGTTTHSNDRGSLSGPTTEHLGDKDR